MSRWLLTEEIRLAADGQDCRPCDELGEEDLHASQGSGRPDLLLAILFDYWDVGRFRRPNGEGRPMDEICLPELRALASEILDATHLESDPIVAMARTAGLGRMRAVARERLEKAFSLEQQARDVSA